MIALFESYILANTRRELIDRCNYSQCDIHLGFYMGMLNVADSITGQSAIRIARSYIGINRMSISKRS